MLYAYGRVSTDEQENSIGNQREKLEAYAKRKGQTLDGVFLDEDQSAFSIPLRQRREGRKLWEALQPGDTVIIPAVDRAFRSNSDAWCTLDAWHTLGVKLVLLDMDIDTSTPNGELVFGIRLATARYESRVNSARQREIFAYLRKAGRPYGGLRPFGWVRKGQGWQESRVERETAGRIIAMRKEGHSYPQIALQLAKLDIRKPVIRKNSRAYYSISDVWYLHQAAIAGFPTRPKVVSLGGRRVAKRPAAVSDAPAPASAE